MNTFKPGRPWYDTDGKLIQAHGGQVTYIDGKYYWYGENKDMTTAGIPICPYWHNGVRCYSSDDLYTWRDEGTLLEANDDLNSPLCRERVIDRPHIIYNKKSGKYIMWMKLTGSPEKPQDWSTQRAGIAVSDSFLGKYEFVREFYPGGEQMGDFDFIKADEGDDMYIYFSHIVGPNPCDVLCMKLTEDYMGVEEEKISYFPYGSPPDSREAPAFFKHGGKIYLTASGTTGYNPNPTLLAVSDKCDGPWEVLGDLCVGDTTESSFHSQISCIFKHPKKDVYIAIGDRWLVDLDLKYLPMIREGHRELQSGKPCPNPKHTWAEIRGLSKRNTSIATYVWLPIRFDENGRPYMAWEEEWTLEELD